MKAVSHGIRREFKSKSNILTTNSKHYQRHYENEPPHGRVEGGGGGGGGGSGGSGGGGRGFPKGCQGPAEAEAEEETAAGGGGGRGQLAPLEKG